MLIRQRESEAFSSAGSPNRTRLLLASIRFANLPSVVSNVWLGVALGVACFSQAGLPNKPSMLEQFGRECGSWKLAPHSEPQLWFTAVLLAFAGIALYVSGNLLNDWHDRHWDARHRPERALPQAAFAPTTYLMLALGCAALGIALAGWVSLPSGLAAGLIAVCIVGYTRWHKSAEWPILLMGLCRGLLPALFLVSCCRLEPNAWKNPLELALFICILGGMCCQSLGLTLYVAALSRTARRESAASAAEVGFRPILLFLIAGCSMLLVPMSPEAPNRLLFLGLVPFIGWLALCFSRCRRPISARVSAMLAGLPLLDWIALVPVSIWLLSLQSPSATDQAVAITSLLLPPAAFFLGRFLQRLSPAT